jgi:hypothetical protein
MTDFTALIAKLQIPLLTRYVSSGVHAFKACSVVLPLFSGTNDA